MGHGKAVKVSFSKLQKPHVDESIRSKPFNCVYVDESIRSKPFNCVFVTIAL